MVGDRESAWSAIIVWPCPERPPSCGFCRQAREPSIGQSASIALTYCRAANNTVKDTTTVDGWRPEQQTFQGGLGHWPVQFLPHTQPRFRFSKPLRALGSEKPAETAEMHLRSRQNHTTLEQNVGKSHCWKIPFKPWSFSRINA